MQFCLGRKKGVFLHRLLREDTSINLIIMPMTNNPNSSPTPESLCYLEHFTDRHVKPLTAEAFYQLIDSPEVKSVMQQIEAEPDQEKKNILKQTLPAAIYGCLMAADGSRPTSKAANVRASGVCIHDFDHLGSDVRQLFVSSVMPLRNEIGLMLAHVTPRGEGLRLVTKLLEGETIPACQQRVADRLSLSLFADKQVKDMTRLSFIPAREYILYIDEKLFSVDVANDLQSASTGKPVEEACQRETMPEHAPEAAPSSQRAEAEMSVVPGGEKLLAADVFDYQGVKYSTIIQDLLSRIATDGLPCEGERNDDLYLVARELRHVCGYQFEMLHMLLSPYFKNLPDNEIRRTINSAINSSGRTLTPTMKGILAQHKSEDADSEDASRIPLPTMPKLPPMMDMIVKFYPKAIHPHVVLAMLPILGTYGTHVRFRYLDNRLNSLTFMTAIVGKSGRGKAFVNHLYELLTPILNAWDQEERKKDQLYQFQMDRRKQDEEYPDDPCAKVRLFSDDTTTSQMLEYLDNLKGEHALQYTEEVARLVTARGSRYANNDDLYCKSFDNAIAGKESKNRQTRNIRTKIYLNTLFAGTYRSMHNFYNNPEGGLNNRVTFALLPDKRHKGIPFYADPDEEQKKLIDASLRMLWMACTKEEVEQLEVKDITAVHMSEQEMEFPFLDKAIQQWIAKCDVQDAENPDETWRDMANRAAVIGYRAGVLAWLLWGRPEDQKTLTLVKKFAIWVAEVDRIGLYNFCGDEYDSLLADEYNQPKVRNTKNMKLFSLLPDQFSRKDVQALKAKYGESPTSADMVISRWTGDGKIVKDAPGQYHKVKSMVC